MDKVTARPGNSDVRVEIRPPYGKPYVMTVDEAAESFGVGARTVKDWCTGRLNAPYHYSFRYADGYQRGMSEEHWRAPMSKKAKTMYEAMRERRRRELGE